MEKNMQENFEKLEGRLFDSLYKSDTEKINYYLREINTPTIITGVGGSSVASIFAGKVLNKENEIITKVCEPRDLKYINLKGYENIINVSYSGNNYGCDLSFNNNLKHYLLSSKENNKADVNLTYKVIDAEKSFISLANTLIPCAVLLNYAIGNNYEYIIDDYEDNYEFSFNPICDAYEIFSGLDSITPAKYLESTMIEAGIGTPIIHDKYSYCHGRSTYNLDKKNNAIIFDNGSDLDKLLLEELPKYYQEVIIIPIKDFLFSEYLALQECLFLTKYIAESLSKDLSGVDYSPFVKKLYHFNGSV